MQNDNSIPHNWRLTAMKDALMYPLASCKGTQKFSTIKIILKKFIANS